MNERIRELLVEAREQTKEGKWHPPISVWAEKFAKLIIQECAKVVNDTEYPYENEADKNTWDTCCVWSAGKMKEHFGVK